MKTPLVDHEGFPRADIDIFAIRHARAALLPLYNDLKYKMDEIHDALANLHLQSKNDPGIITSPKELIPFAKISGVAPDSPADEAGLLRGDLVIEFDDINSNTKEPLKKMAAEIGGLEFKAIRVIVQRDGQRLSLRVTPKPWNGRGLLGSHLVPI
jgi:26S proteasome non-ATPase regulatory subunit 9